MDALYRGLLMALRQLKEKYHKASLRTVAPAKIKVSQRQRLPPTILSYTQTKTNTKTSNPLPKQTKTNNPLLKQIIVEPQTKTNNPLPKQIILEPQTKTNNPLPKPQTKIVQESRKRKGEELPHLVKRTRPTLLPHRQVQAFSFSMPGPMSFDEMSLPSGLVEFGTQSLADEIRQALEEGLEDLGEETEDEEEE